MPAQFYSVDGPTKPEVQVLQRRLRLAEGVEAMVADQAEAAGAAGRTVPPYARDAVAVVEAAGSDAESGLTQAEVASRLSTYGTNQIVI